MKSINPKVMVLATALFANAGVYAVQHSLADTQGNNQISDIDYYIELHKSMNARHSRIYLNLSESSALFDIGFLVAEIKEQLGNERYDEAYQRLNEISGLFVITSAKKIHKELIKNSIALLNKQYEQNIYRLKEWMSFFDPYIARLSKSGSPDYLKHYQFGRFLANYQLHYGDWDNSLAILKVEELNNYINYFSISCEHENLVQALNEILEVSQQDGVHHTDVSVLRKKITRVRSLLG
ncbi:MAG: hypothetical protein ACE5EH_07565 [Gammaproteobacteria bacterium]